ncbi:hypothetical protein ACGFNV_14690 [Streptomyces sp. NPDC048751]|uniref:hypothetical protein n=1 Tax=Streptomyces sp. NPDC048751 TaxID=3365591 RepID=UPI003717C4CF
MPVKESRPCFFTPPPPDKADLFRPPIAAVASATVTTSSWYVFLEEDAESFESLETKGLFLHRWHLVASQHVEAGRQAAEARARELADSHVPQHVAKRLEPRGRPHRSVFRMQDGTWLVRVRYGYAKTHFRVSMGELVRTEEEVEGGLKEESYAPRGGLRGLFGI